jgi:hypothetical protein
MTVEYIGNTVAYYSVNRRVPLQCWSCQTYKHPLPPHSTCGCLSTHNLIPEVSKQLHFDVEGSSTDFLARITEHLSERFLPSDVIQECSSQSCISPLSSLEELDRRGTFILPTGQKLKLVYAHRYGLFDAHSKVCLWCVSPDQHAATHAPEHLSALMQCWLTGICKSFMAHDRVQPVTCCHRYSRLPGWQPVCMPTVDWPHLVIS